MFAAEVQHLLGLGDPADERTGETFATEEQSKGGNLEWCFRSTHQGNVSVTTKHIDVGVDVVMSGDGIQDEVERSGLRPHLFGVAGNDHLVGPQTERILFLAWRGGKDHDVGAEGAGKLDPHVTQSPEADYPHFFPLEIAPPVNGRVGRNPGAEERCDSGRIKVGGDIQDEAFIHDNAFGIAAVGNPPQMFIRGVVGKGSSGAELLKTITAVGAGMV